MARTAAGSSDPSRSTAIRNQYQLLLKKFDALKQTGSVDDYQAEFEKLAQGILLYNSNYDDTYFVTRGKADVTVKENEDKLASLRETRRKNGLCFKCGAKWGHNHKCPAQVPLHVLEEILDALEPMEDLDAEVPTEMEEEIIAIVSQSSSLENVRRRTMRICGNIGKLIKIPNLQWTAQGHTFVSSVGVLSLRCFDMIVRADWLEEHSPMWVHWARKIMRFTMAGKRVTLQGSNHDIEQCPAVSGRALRGLLNRQAVTHCIQLRLDPTSYIQFKNIVAVATISDQEMIPQVEQLLEQYDDIF
ncbi:unnamed protein product [Miscanthus lutarioriparius]|uniref:Uncharacterized protein n=1 Tax=Miscanthus lutarioriparius TaxID=422564 RepID=A0A811Q5A0_9POAL|nr:unnamed protein product [Miscanthus lutarioriparius]